MKKVGIIAGIVAVVCAIAFCVYKFVLSDKLCLVDDDEEE